MAANQRRMCLRKRRFADAADAAERASATQRRAYRCPHCNGWHLTTKAKR
jgi:hypothetical protein